MTLRDNLELRAARDRVVDLLKNFGRTAPLRDVEVIEGSLLVPLNGSASVRLDLGQTDVDYELHHRDGTDVADSDAMTGTGGETTLATPKITSDITYRVFATKNQTDRLPVYLHDLAPIRVRLDTTLPARIIAVDSTEAEGTEDSAPRITDYDSAVQVEIDEPTQVGVDYELVTSADGGQNWDVISQDAVRGDGARIVLTALPATDDIELRVRASRTFDPSENFDDQVEILDVEMPLKVRANSTLAVSATDPIVDHNGSVAVTVSNTQVTVGYQLHARTLLWDDFWYGTDDPPGTLIDIEVPDEPDVHVRRPPFGGSDGAGHAVLLPLGTTQQGTGGDLLFDLGPLGDDTVVLMTATKDHGTSSSVVELDAASAILVRPDGERMLSLSVPVRDRGFVDTMQVAGGQPGVLYYFTEDSDDSEPHLPVYFPEPDERGRDDRGIEQMLVGVDFIVAQDDPDRDPTLDFSGALTLPVTFRVRAVKARTRVDALMTHTVDVGIDPPIRVEQADLVTGDSARVIVDHIVAGEEYEAFIDGLPIQRSEDGGRIVFETDPLTADSTIVLRAATHDTASGWAIERLYTWEVNVWPNLVVRIVAPPLDPGDATPTGTRLVDFLATPNVEIEGSEPDVDYRVVVVTGDSTRVVSARPVRGDGALIEIPLRALQDDVELRIRMTRSVVTSTGDETREVLFPVRLPVAVRADHGRPLTVGDGTGEHMAEVPLTVRDSQLNVGYQVHTRALSDADVLPTEDDRTITVGQDGNDVIVRSPWSEVSDEQLLPSGFTAVGPATPGTGDDLVVSAGAHDDDIAVLVTAIKDHSGTSSTVALRQPSIVFIRPDRDPRLALLASIAGGRIDTVMLSGGQERVLYRLRNGARGVEHDLPAYVHGHVDDHNRGIDALRVGLDLIPTRGPGVDGATAPFDPVVTLSRRPAVGATLHVRASKIRTGLSAPLDETAAVPPLPKVSSVRSDEGVQVTIDGSVAGERYELRVEGVVSGGPIVGDGSNIELTTEALAAGAVVELFVSRPDDSGLPVVRVVTLDVEA